MKKHIITIAGDLISGKSKTADGVAKKLGFQRFSSGDFMKNLALARGTSLAELSIQAETDHSIDNEIDEEVRKSGKEDNLVIDSRLGFYLIPGTFKVFLTLPPEIAKDRYIEDLKSNLLRSKSDNASSPEEAFEKIKTRRESEAKRYKDIHGIDNTDKKYFDLVISTDKNDIEKVIDTIVSGYKKWIAE